MIVSNSRDCVESPLLDISKLLTAAFIDLWTAGQAWTMQYWSRRTGRPLTADDFEPLTWAMYEMGLSRTSADYLSALEVLQRVSRQIMEIVNGKADVSGMGQMEWSAKRVKP